MSRSALALTMVAGAALSSLAPDVAPAADPQPQLVIHHANLDVFAPTLSHSGRYVAHIAVRRDQDSPRQQVWRTDVDTGRHELLNPSIDGGIAAGNYSRPPVISGNATRVSFSSDATRLVAGDTNGNNDAFVRDAARYRTLIASVAFDGEPADGDVGMASLSKNGRYVVFTSDATDLVPGSTTTNNDVYRRDLTNGQTVQVTVRPDGSPSRGPGSTSTDVSGNGNLVAFNSYNTDLAPADGDDGEADLFIRNLSNGTTRWLSSGLPVGANPAGVVISPDGRWVSSRWDDGSLHLTRVSTAATTTVAVDGYALLGSFSTDLGRFVFMAGGAPYVRDLATGVDTAIPVPAGGSVTSVTISGSGRYAAYDWLPDDGGASRIFRVAL